MVAVDADQWAGKHHQEEGFCLKALLQGLDGLSIFRFVAVETLEEDLGLMVGFFQKPSKHEQVMIASLVKFPVVLFGLMHLLKPGLCLTRRRQIAPHLAGPTLTRPRSHPHKLRHEGV